MDLVCPWERGALGEPPGRPLKPASGASSTREAKHTGILVLTPNQRAIWPGRWAELRGKREGLWRQETWGPGEATAGWGCPWFLQGASGHRVLPGGRPQPPRRPPSCRARTLQFQCPRGPGHPCGHHSHGVRVCPGACRCRVRAPAGGVSPAPGTDGWEGGRPSGRGHRGWGSRGVRGRPGAQKQLALF